jgi:hypothetical protein
MVDIREHIKNVWSDGLEHLLRETDPLGVERNICFLRAAVDFDRVGLLSDRWESCLPPAELGRLLSVLRTAALFPDPDSLFLVTVEPFLRLLASVLRLYQIHHASLPPKIHEDLSEELQVILGRRSEGPKEQLVERGNVTFLIQHCRLLLDGIDTNDSLARSAATLLLQSQYIPESNFIRRYEKAEDCAGRRLALPMWHARYIQMEDLCLAVFVSSVKADTLDKHSLAKWRLLENESTASKLLYGCLEYVSDSEIERKRGFSMTPFLLLY